VITRGIVGLLLVVGCGLFGQKMWREWMDQPVFMQASTTGVGQIEKHKFADGTQLILNADSSVELVYYRNKRVAILKRGEVIFEVAKDQERPFIVDSGYAHVTLLGTNFGVNRLSHLVRISVAHGRVKVEAQDDQGKAMHEPLVLSDGEVAEIGAGNSPMRVKRNAQDAFSFQSGSITFQQATMDEIAETLSRYRKPEI